MPQAPQKPVGTPLWTGRFSLQIEGDSNPSFSASFELSGAEQQGGLVLISPLGNVLAQLNWTGGHARLTTPETTRESGSLAALITDLAGIDLPINALFDWFEGTPTHAPGWQADLSSISAGRVTAHRYDPVPQATLRIALTR
ncbi:MAG: lipoprotein insertase outer membrane protein LolB [Burkholderiaceae bacterium]|nr:lipoprotein insertase outer membrane protein LolB [Burkholderiaceae bacterium]